MTEEVPKLMFMGRSMLTTALRQGICKTKKMKMMSYITSNFKMAHKI